MMDTIRRVAAQAVRLANTPADPRPSWLRRMPGAADPRAAYYLFLHLLTAERYGISRCLEIGTDGGTAAMHKARPGGHVVTLDINPGCAPNVNGIAAYQELRVQGVTVDASRSDPRIIAGQFDGPIVLLFIDGDHTYPSASGDYQRFGPLVRHGGYIVMDDTRLNDGMARAWQEVDEPKVELSELHYMGFGVAVRG